jgi:tetratricopeptide (TPR) repeat protein
VRRGLPFLIGLYGCAEMSLPPTIPAGNADLPIVQEQALLGLQGGEAAVAELVDADGEHPKLVLLRFDADGRGKEWLAAPADIAGGVASELRKHGSAAVPLLAAAVAAQWPRALQAAADAGFRAGPATLPEPGRRRWAARGKVPLSLRTANAEGSPPATLLLLAERPGGRPAGDEVELARQPIAGRAIDAELWIAGNAVWMLAGSTAGSLRGAPLRRTIAVRRASLARGEAELHNGHGLADYGAGDLDAARREFARAIAADAAYFDALYNGAAVAALSGRDQEAIALLERAARVDPGRLQVLGRSDEDLRILRRRIEVRGLLGLKRPPPGDLDPPQ